MERVPIFQIKRPSSYQKATKMVVIIIQLPPTEVTHPPSNLGINFELAGYTSLIEQLPLSSPELRADFGPGGGVIRDGQPKLRRLIPVLESSRNWKIKRRRNARGDEARGDKDRHGRKKGWWERGNGVGRSRWRVGEGRGTRQKGEDGGIGEKGWLPDKGGLRGKKLPRSSPPPTL